MKNLGTMNGWTTQPAEYTNHINNCGSEYQATIIYNEKHPSGVGLIRKERQETRRKYDTVVTKVGTYSVKRTETCNECGCSWTSYS
jgi:heterodisulfide reductase subunit B